MIWWHNLGVRWSILNGQLGLHRLRLLWNTVSFHICVSCMVMDGCIILFLKSRRLNGHHFSQLTIWSLPITKCTFIQESKDENEVKYLTLGYNTDSQSGDRGVRLSTRTFFFFTLLVFGNYVALMRTKPKLPPCFLVLNEVQMSCGI